MRHCVWIGTIGVGLLLACTQPVLSSEKAPAFGEQVSPASFTDIHYLPRTLADFGEKRAYVVVFTTLDCPVVKRYLPRLISARREPALSRSWPWRMKWFGSGAGPTAPSSARRLPLERKNIAFFPSLPNHRPID